MNCPACRAPNDDASLCCTACDETFVPSTLSTLKPGSLVASRYEVLQFVGKGGMGVVLKARDQALDEVVALKVLRADLAESAEMDRRFRTEIKLARRVRHRNVCGIHEYGEDGALRYIAMEFIEGTDLRHILRETGGPLPQEAYEIAIQAGEGLQAIHEAGVIHRDLKTSNIMRDQRGFVRLMDFGIAKDTSGEFTAGATGTGQLIGTPEYMSPEQIRGEKLDFRSDIYALGIVIYELFTGRVPFQADTPIATILKHLQEPVPLEGPQAARLPRELIPVLARALAKDRAQRQENVAEVLEDLRQARETAFPGAAPARVTGPHTRPRVPASRTSSSRVTAVPTVVPTVGMPAPVPATRALPRRAGSAAPAPGQAARAVPPRRLWIVMPALAVVAAGAAYFAMRTLALRPPAPLAAADPTPALSPAPEVSQPLAPLPAARPTPSAPPTAAPPTTAPAARRATPAPVSPPPRPAAPSSAELAELDRAATRDPEAALAEANALLSRHPGDAALRDRAARYRSAAAELALGSARQSLARADASSSLDDYLEAGRLFSKALDVDPGSRAAREGLAQAIRGEERVRARLSQFSFEQSGTEVSGAPSNDLPPGLAAPPPGVEIKRAQPAGPRARIVIEIEPRQLKPGEDYVLRYFLKNESASPLMIAGASIQNQIGSGGVSGGRVEPATSLVGPRSRSLLFEARDVWRHELGTSWQTTLRVFLTDGSVFSSTLAARP